MRDKFKAARTAWRQMTLAAASASVLPLGCAGIDPPSPTFLTDSLPPLAVRRFTAETSQPKKSRTRPRIQLPFPESVTPGKIQLAKFQPAPVVPPVDREPAKLRGTAVRRTSSPSPSIDGLEVRRTGVVPPVPAVAEKETTGDSIETEVETDFLDSQELDLSTALQLVGGQNPQVAFAHQRIQEAAADKEAADAMWLPSIRAGMSLHRHDGNLQASNGVISDVNRTSLQGGFGTNAVGAGTTPTPGLSAQFHVSDAIFAPRIAERTQAARQFGSWVTYQNEMLAAAELYIELLRAHQEQAIALETLSHAGDLAKQTASFASSGQGNQADADRAATELAIRKNELVRAEEAIEVASARLAELLHLDAPRKVQPMEQQLAPIELVSLEPSVQEMVATGLASRPELGEIRELVNAACARLKREEFAPLVPSVLLGLSYGGFGGGLGDHISEFNDRVDFDLGAVWEVRNLGWGESAARRSAESRVEMARFQEMRTLDRVAREIVEARSQVRSRRKQIDNAKAAIEVAEQAYERDRNRINQGQGLPVEVLQSIQALDRARREYLDSIARFNTAQFRLHHAIGWPSDVVPSTWSQ